LKRTVSVHRDKLGLTRTRFVCLLIVASLMLTCLSSLFILRAVADMDSMVIGGDGVPGLVDPATIRGTPLLQLCLNVYETLIFFDREKIDSFIPGLATSWQISPDGLTYVFTIRQGVTFQNGNPLTTADVEYSFKRILVTDDNLSYASWLFYDALFGLPGSHDSQGNIIVNSSQINNAITRNDTTVTFHLAHPYPPFMQILAAYGFVVNKDWCIALGDWPGTWDNWTAYNRQPTAINKQNRAPPGPHVNAMCGTGPYKLDYIKSGVECSIIIYKGYWGRWPAIGAKGWLERVTFKKIVDWNASRDMFLAGELDMLDVPRAAINEVLGQPGVRCMYPLPELSCYSMLFTFNISTSSPYLGVLGGLPAGTINESGIPPDFFNDINVRRGFAYAFNYTQLIDEAMLGEAFQPATPIIPELAFYNPSQEKYAQNLTEAAALFQTAWNGTLWANGFNMTICYFSDSAHYMQKACEIVKSDVESLNSKFHINILNFTLDEYLNLLQAKELTLFFGGWLCDFADPHDFALAFMSSEKYGTFADFQNYKNSTIDALVDEGIITTNTSRRQEIYYDLQQLYWEDCPGVPLFQPRQRKFMRDWVQGWYCNSLFSTYADRFYEEWKEIIPPWPLTSGENTVDAVSSTGTVVFINTTSEGNLTIASCDINLEGITTEGTEVHSVKCVTVDTTVPPENITFPINISVYYTDQEVVSTYVDQSTLRMFYWNGTDWIVENDTGFVVGNVSIEGKNYSGYVWARIWHLSEFAVMGQMALIHAVAPLGVRWSKNFIGQGFTTTVYVDAFNQGDYEETLNITVYANTTVIGSFTNLTLSARNSATIPIVGNTSTLVKGTYRIVAVVAPVPGENTTVDNTVVGGQVLVTIPGDINGDGTVDIYDAILLSGAFNSSPGSAKWNPNADINSDGTVDIYDAIILSGHFNQHYP